MIIFSANSTFITLHLHRWPDGGCPIHYYVIEYKEETQPTWRIVSNNIRSEEESIIISDLKPGTWYSLQLTAHNGAGSRVVTTQFATLSITGQTLLPRIGSTPGTRLDQVDGSIALPIISAIIVTSTLLLVGVYVFRKRRYLGLGRYAGYTQGSSEYSVKSLTERDVQPGGNQAGQQGKKGGEQGVMRTPLYSPHSLSRPSKGGHHGNKSGESNPYSSLPYATYRRPAPNVPPSFPPTANDFSHHFQTFGRHECFAAPCPIN